MNLCIHAHACGVILGTLAKDSPLHRLDANDLIDGGVSDVGFFVAVRTKHCTAGYEVFTTIGACSHDATKKRKWRVNATDTKQQRKDTKLRFELIRGIAKIRGWL